MRRRVLVIEDNEQNRYLLSFLLQKHGYDIVTAADGPTGIELARRTELWAILLDIQLPVMDGYEIARILRADPVLETIPIIAVTSYAMPGDLEKALAAGCSGYLEKPIEPETFVASVERLVAEVAR
ncbi:MAG: response regulator [Kofleriaceae bacterium]